MIRAITLDLDDTLWPILPVMRHAEAVLMNHLGRHFPRVIERWTPERFQAARRTLLQHRPEIAHNFSEQRLATLREALVDSGYDAQHAATVFDVFFRARNDVELFPDVEVALDQLAAHYPLAAVTNGNADLAMIGLHDRVATTIYARHHARPKPHPDMFEAACAALGVAPHQVLHVGDHPEQDVEAARRIGMQSVWIERNGAPWPHPGPPPTTIRSLTELLPLLGVGPDP